MCVFICVFWVCACHSIKGQAPVLAGCGWNVTQLTVRAAAHKYHRRHLRKDLFSPVCRLSHTQTVTWKYGTHTITHTAVRSHRNNLKAVESPRSELCRCWLCGYFEGQFHLADGNMCVCARKWGESVFFHHQGGQSPGVSGNSLSKYSCVIVELCAQSCACACVFIHVCVHFICITCMCSSVRLYGFSVCVHACMHACVCVYVCGAGWHQAKVNRRLVSVLHAFSDLTGPVQALRHVNEVCGCVCLCKCVCIGDEGSQSIIHKSYCPLSMCVCTVCWERRQMS